MKAVRQVVAVAVMVAGCASIAVAEGPNADVIAKITGLQPEVKNGIATVRVPRSDISVVVDGVTMTPFQGLTSWAAFEQAGDKTMVMGDLTLTEDQVNPTMSAALDNGLEVTALHNHFFYDRPRVFFMHIGGMGTIEQLATGVAKALAAAKGASGSPAEGFGGAAIPAPSAIDAQPLEAIFGQPGQTKDGMVKFVFGKTTSMHGAEAGAGMGVNTWAAFAGSPKAAVVDGDFAMLEDELQGVLKSLRHANVNIVAIHNHMTHEQPRILFLHFWAKGPADELARKIKAALDTQAK
ncbi:MAG: DUF1259 domain-containing protein [Deltaproteobacteria bacterium]|nr:DUF1259 domain-containing protein [Deltaproteobacteria bacterium]